MKPIPYGKQSISLSDILTVSAALLSPNLTQGPTVNKFENKISNLVGSEFCLSTNSATSALIAAFYAVGLSPGDLVWTSSITFVATSNAALHIGCKIDFVEIDSLTGLLSLESLETKLVNARITNQLPKCVCIVHLYGLCIDMQRLYDLSIQYGFSIVEDASHALGTLHNDSYIGSCRYSQACVFSFHPVKNITTAEGGCLTTNCEEIFTRARKLISHGITKNRAEFINRSLPPWSYEQHLLGFNFRMNDIQAALGISQLKRLLKFKQRRRYILDHYRYCLNELPLSIISAFDHTDPFYHLAVLRLDDAKYQRLLYQHLLKSDIYTQVHYTPVHLQPFYQSLGFFKGYLPISEEFSTRILTIPLFPQLTKMQLRFIIDTIVHFFEVNN